MINVIFGKRLKTATRASLNRHWPLHNKRGDVVAILCSEPIQHGIALWLRPIWSMRTYRITWRPAFESWQTALNRLLARLGLAYSYQEHVPLSIEKESHG